MIQHIYDSHYDGADRARDFVLQWEALQGHIDEERYRDILSRLQYQAGEAVVWRDTICNWIYRFRASRTITGESRFLRQEQRLVAILLDIALRNWRSSVNVYASGGNKVSPDSPWLAQEVSQAFGKCPDLEGVYVDD